MSEKLADHALAKPLTAIAGVGPALAAKLERLDLNFIEDLLFALPLRFEDKTRLTPIAALRHGHRAQVLGEILLCDVVFRGRRSLLARIGDESGGQLTMRLFHFSRAQEQGLQPGRKVLLYGDARAGPGGVEMIHPEYRVMRGSDAPELASSLTPVYPITDGISQYRMRKLVSTAIEILRRESPNELLPESLIEKRGLPALTDAILRLHHPPAGMAIDELTDGAHPAIQRLALEELIAHRLSLRALRDRNRGAEAPVFGSGLSLIDAFLSSLSFALTDAQTRVAKEIALDMASPKPMQRLVQGDVGSGKTVVACLAALQAVAAGFQVAVMAPTEILAEQHFRAFTGWLDALNINVVLLKGKLRAADRRLVLGAIETGNAQLVIGTHALFQASVQFSKLGLVVIDEQHRFGVEQRLELTRKSSSAGVQAHQLVMTATPIPRTLAMTAYADLDTSVIDELPPGRTPVTTAVLPDQRRGEIIARIGNECAAGKQAYWVCPLIEESEVLDAEAAEARFAQLKDDLPGLNIGLIHGRLKPAEKDRVMQAFKAGELSLLVATTVIEVGVDVPNASLMIIENAERLGLSQLHQLRGRVGRGAAVSSCLLLYRGSLSQMAKARLGVMRDTNDGFVVAEKDLELRGPGEVLGTRQTGAMNFRIADLSRDRELMDDVVAATRDLRRGSSAVTDALIDRWLGNARRFADV